MEIKQDKPTKVLLVEANAIEVKIGVVRHIEDLWLAVTKLPPREGK
jgi:hypothetical protein